MRWATVRDAGGRERSGIVLDDRLHALEPGVRLLDVLETLNEAGDRAKKSPADVLDMAEVTLLAPIPRPPSIRDFYAFEQHAAVARKRRGLEMDPDWYELPVFYFTNPAAVIGDGAAVPVPPGSAAFDYELEVAAVVGKGGSDLDPATAEEHIAGFMVMNDWSARDLQAREMKLSLGPAKGKDSATTLGPFLVTPDELEPHRSGRAYALTMRAKVNGREYSRGSLGDIYWSFGEFLAYASRGTRLVPGDVIGSGTCGTGCILELSTTHSPEEYPWLRPGDEVVLEVEHLGRLRNRVVEGNPPKALRP
jgi:2-keto-4-pentenoate hydratase/2-oxohepta-3-ene-1,7-dioic acid hydratase in catechol pathway